MSDLAAGQVMLVVYVQVPARMFTKTSARVRARSLRCVLLLRGLGEPGGGPGYAGARAAGRTLLGPAVAGALLSSSFSLSFLASSFHSIPRRVTHAMPCHAMPAMVVGEWMGAVDGGSDGVSSVCTPLCEHECASGWVL